MNNKLTGPPLYAAVRARVAELRELDARADLDPLKSCHIISDGWTHCANLCETLDPLDGYDPVCHCGVELSKHSAYEGHSFVEMEMPPEYGRRGRGRCLAMIPTQWADVLAAARNSFRQSLDCIEALCDRQEAGHAKQCELVRWAIRCDDHRCDCGYAAAEDALRAFLDPRGIM